jgi:SAM-dependent methyltransferase
MNRPHPKLTGRQLRELAFYEEHCRQSAPASVSFDPIEGAEQRPWNPAWHAYGILRRHYRQGARRLLDLGCGTGVASIRFARLGYDVTGVDLAPSCIVQAIESARLNGLADDVTFKIGVAERLEFPDDSFDAVAGFDILHHVDIRSAVDEIFRVLKPGGIAVFKEWVESPALDQIRKLPPLRWLFPLGRSIRLGITEDERKLTRADLKTITSQFPLAAVTRFRFLARLNRLLSIPPGSPSILERADARLFRLLPFLRRFGGAAVIVLTKADRESAPAARLDAVLHSTHSSVP